MVWRKVLALEREIEREKRVKSKRVLGFDGRWVLQKVGSRVVLHAKDGEIGVEGWMEMEMDELMMMKKEKRRRKMEFEDMVFGYLVFGSSCACVCLL